MTKALYHIIGDLEESLIELRDYQIANPTKDISPLLDKYGIRELVEHSGIDSEIIMCTAGR